MVSIDEVTTAGGDEPSWKQRAVERTTGAAKLRAEQRARITAARAPRLDSNVNRRG
jgi:hypothetical protein